MSYVPPLTPEQLDNMTPHKIFSDGYVKDAWDGVNMTGSNKAMRWMAQRGGIGDWCIYIHWADKGLHYIADHGDKVTSEKHIRRLVPCTDEALKRYRF